MKKMDDLATRLVAFYRAGLRECFRTLWSFYGGQPSPTQTAELREQAMWDAWERQLREDQSWRDRDIVPVCACPRCWPT